MILSLLLMLVALNDQSHPLMLSPWWLASGIAGGLALLTKSPALFLMPFAGLLALLQSFRSSKDQNDLRRLGGRALYALLAATVWIDAAIIVWVALWPAAWIDPLGAAGRMALTGAE